MYKNVKDRLKKNIKEYESKCGKQKADNRIDSLKGNLNTHQIKKENS